ncbi:lactosylceramide 1,3-N-acetyl-beta-D-glucosaminyltransferase A [Patella vulgata]|uniref:lactosylceramide 1,3-N-acetyl-beta-D-glucosaminyltransferase A n=1 Tax=Patella vulgata TaxID=6465 RepID=UPI00217FBBFC|nr:lactosylceramide 1,3-N-acetyl-beta-D-glucosaminyltransferase A [Patella vulgata]
MSFIKRLFLSLTSLIVGISIVEIFLLTTTWSTLTSHRQKFSHDTFSNGEKKVSRNLIRSHEQKHQSLKATKDNIIFEKENFKGMRHGYNYPTISENQDETSKYFYKPRKTSKRRETEFNATEEKYFIPRDHDVNGVNFSFLLDGGDICLKSKPFIIFLIHSTAKNDEARKDIRNTWASSIRQGYWYKGFSLDKNVTYVFILGNSTRNVTTAVANENRLYGDIVQASFEESYKNTIYKSYMGFRWVRKYCKDVSFVVKVDEDVFVHVPNIISYLQNLPTDVTVNQTIFGVLSGNNGVYRSPAYYKWTISYEEYPLRSYPLHASGGIYFMARTVAMDLINMADFIPLVHIEDAFFCGILRKVLGFTTEEPDILLLRGGIPIDCMFYYRKSLLALHPVGSYYKIKLWNDLPDLNKTVCRETDKQKIRNLV